MIYISDKEKIHLKNSVVCLGNFDGLHLGHQKLIKKCIDLSKKNKYKSVMFSFNPHPKEVIYNKKTPLILTSIEKINILKNMDLDYFIEYPFTQMFAKFSPERFFNEIIVNSLGCRILVVGEGYKFGKGKSGSYKDLHKLCDLNGIKLFIVPHLNIGKNKISSSEIRNLILNNNFILCKKLLSRSFFIMGKFGKGTLINNYFIKIEFEIPSNKLSPNDGVFYTKTIIENEAFKSISRIKTNQSNSIKIIKNYIYGLNKDYENENIKVLFHKKIN